MRRRSTILWPEARSLWSLHFRFDAELGNWVRISAALIDGSVDREEPILVLRDKIGRAHV